MGPTSIEFDRYLFYDRLECGICREELVPDAAVTTATAAATTRQPKKAQEIMNWTTATRANTTVEASTTLATRMVPTSPASTAFPLAGLFKTIKFSRKRAGCCSVQKTCAQNGEETPCPAEPVRAYTLQSLQQCMNKCHMAHGCTTIEFTKRKAKLETGTCEVIFSPVRRARQGSCSCFGYSPNVNLWD